MSITSAVIIEAADTDTFNTLAGGGSGGSPRIHVAVVISR